jgi:hypothetical protein
VRPAVQVIQTIGVLILIMIGALMLRLVLSLPLTPGH